MLSTPMDYAVRSPQVADFLTSPEVISLRASVNDKDIELIDMRRQLQKSLKEVRGLKNQLDEKEKERALSQKKHEQSVLKLERECHSKNDSIHKLNREARNLAEDLANTQKKLKDLTKEKNGRIDILKDEFKTQLDAAKKHLKDKEEAEEKVLKLRRDLSLIKHEKKLSEDLSNNEHARLKIRIQEITTQLDQATKDATRLRSQATQKDTEIKRLKQECEEKDKQLLLSTSQAPAAQFHDVRDSSASHLLPSSLPQSRRLEFELYEKEQRRKVEAMQQSLYKLQEKLDSRVQTSRKYKEAGRMLQRKVATLEAERYSKQSIIDALESRIDTLDKEMETTCQQLYETKKENDQLKAEFERELTKKEHVLREALKDKESAEHLADQERQRFEGIQAELSQLLDKNRKLDNQLMEIASISKSQKEELESLQTKSANLKRRGDSAEEHIEKLNGLLKEKDLDAERSRARYQEQQAMIERQEHELNGMRIQYESHLKKVSQVQSQMHSQRQELERFRHLHFNGHDPMRSRRTSYSREPLGDPVDAFQNDTYEDQLSYLKSELNRSMQREKALIFNIQDRDKKLENAEKYLGNMDKVVETLSKYSQ